MEIDVLVCEAGLMGENDEELKLPRWREYRFEKAGSEVSS